MKEQSNGSPLILRPGARAPVSGIYQNTLTGNEVTLTRGERLPPTQVPGHGYRLVHRAVHARPRKKPKAMPGQMVLMDTSVEETYVQARNGQTLQITSHGDTN